MQNNSKDCVIASLKAEAYDMSQRVRDYQNLNE
jgi:hypothetical protein